MDGGGYSAEYPETIVGELCACTWLASPICIVFWPWVTD